MLACSVGVHALVLAALLLWGTEAPDPRVARGLSVLDTISLSNTKAQTAQEAEKPVVDVSSRPTVAAFVVKLPRIAQSAASIGADGPLCQIAAAVQADLLADEAARNEIATIPFDQRSVASAVVLWSASPEHVRPSLPATEQLMFDRLHQMLPECLDLDQAGPDFLYVTADERTVAIAIGSGQWRWRTYFDVLSASQQEAKSEPGLIVPAE